MRVIGVDPGKASGLVLVENGEVVEWAEPDQRETVRWLYDRVPTVDIVVCETWKPRGGPRTFQPYSLELLGFVRGLCWLTGVTLVLQDPVIKVKFHDRAMSRYPEAGRGGAGHARDAVAHVLFYILTHKHTWESSDED